MRDRRFWDLGERFPGINWVAIKAWVPAHGRLFVEAGFITAFTSLQLCGGDEDCEARFGTTAPPNEDRQLLLPAGGLRFVHYYAIRSEPR